MIYWKSIKEKPSEEGIYVVANFDDEGNMAEFSCDYAYLRDQGGFIPNHPMIGLRRITHYMTYGDYRTLLGAQPREDIEGNIVL